MWGVGRRAFSVLTVLSAIGGVAIVAFWVRSYRVAQWVGGETQFRQ